VTPVNAYYYWVRAKTSSMISPMSYVGMGYASLSPDQRTGTADIGVSDFVFLPVNILPLSSPGTISCRVMNNGPDEMSSSGVGFDFYLTTNTAEMIWIGSAQSNMTLNSGEEGLVILPSSAKVGLRVREDLAGVETVKVTVRHLSGLYDPNPENNTCAAAGTVLVRTNGVNSIGRAFNDYDGDGKADGPIYRSSDGKWDVCLSGYRYQAYVTAIAGMAGLTPVPGDYDGDGITDFAVYNRVNGWWTILFSSTDELASGEFGGPEYTVVSCDFDGDGKTDPVVYRDADGYWYGLASSMRYMLEEAPGCWPGYTPVPGDYDGDGLADPAAYYNGRTGEWILGPSSSGYFLLRGVFGGPGWVTVSADYDGDGKTDPAIYAAASGAWQALLSGSGYALTQAFLEPSPFSLPVPADYDGDGKADPAVYQIDTGIWRVFLSTLGYRELSGGFGGPAYQPVQE